MDVFPSSVQAAIDLPKVRFIPRAHNIFARRKILVRSFDIYWPNVPPDFTRETLRRQSVLMHELAHVWQYATGQLTAASYLLNPANWQYRYRFDASLGFDDYPTEQQADLIQDWFLMNHGAPPGHYRETPPTLEQINALIPFKWDKRESSADSLTS